MIKPKKIQYLEKILRLMARVILWKYKPKIIGITGSIGKTSAKEAIFTVLSSSFRIRKNEKNYNNEIGLPLTIIGADSGNRSFWKWLEVFFKWLGAVIWPVDYPEILILEMGVDRPGDMQHLLSIAKPMMGIVTNISSSHIEFFGNLENTAREKGKLIEALPKDGVAILNNDDDLALGMKENKNTPAITFGFGEFAEVSASNVAFSHEINVPQGITFKLSYEGSVLPVRLPRVIAPHLIYAVLSGVAAGLYFKMNLVEIAKAIESFRPPCGRMNLISGIKNTYLIDDTYNASPSSAFSALEVLEELNGKRKIAVLGDMLELGLESEEEHKKVAEKVKATKADKFLAVGERMKAAAQKLAHYPKENILLFDNPTSAGRVLQQLMQPGDLILIKGSQGMRMEKVVEEVMAEPQKAGALLCRQSTEWREKGFVKP